MNIKYLQHGGCEWVSLLKEIRLAAPSDVRSEFGEAEREIPQPFQSYTPFLWMMLPLRTAVISWDVILPGESLPTSLPAPYK